MNERLHKLVELAFPREELQIPSEDEGEDSITIVFPEHTRASILHYEGYIGDDLHKIADTEIADLSHIQIVQKDRKYYISVVGNLSATFISSDNLSFIIPANDRNPPAILTDNIAIVVRENEELHDDGN